MDLPFHPLMLLSCMLHLFGGQWPTIALILLELPQYICEDHSMHWWHKHFNAVLFGWFLLKWEYLVGVGGGETRKPSAGSDDATPRRCGGGRGRGGRTSSIFGPHQYQHSAAGLSRRRRLPRRVVLSIENILSRVPQLWQWYFQTAIDRF